jgi:hypothetical protein
VGNEKISPLEELKRLGEQIESATELAELKPIFYRLTEIIRTYPDDFDVQFTGNESKQRLMVRGALLRQQETFPIPSAPPPSMPAAPPPPVAPTEPPLMPAATPLPLPSPLFDPTPAEQPPPAPAVTSEIPPQPPTRPSAPAPPPPRPKRKRKLALVIWPVVGLLVALVLVFLGVQQARKRSVALVQLDITTTPAGASVKVAAQQPTAGGSQETACTSNCKMMLTPGAYQVFASLDGYEPTVGAVTVTARQPAAVRLTLQPQAPSVRLLSDLSQGKVVVDDQPPVDLQEGQLVLDKLGPGTHTVKLTGLNADVSFAFEIAFAQLPAVAVPVNARNMIAVLVTSFGKQARIVTNAGPWKLALNGQPQSDAGPVATDLTGFLPGVNEIVVGQGPDQRNMSETFGAAPMLTAFLKTDVNAGTLIVSTSEDDVRVFLNEKEYRRRTQRGQLRVQILGKVTVRVAKSGFQNEPAQTVEVKKGAELRLKFDLKEEPRFASLQIHGAAAGTAVSVDQKNAGTVGPDGAFSLGAIEPGDHTIELRRDQHQTKRLQRSFRAGQAVVLAGADAVLAVASGAIRLTRNPASSIVTYRRGDETESHETRGDQIELPPGIYAFSASAPGFTESTVRVQLAAGETRTVDFALARERPAAPPPAVARGMEEFEDAQSWKKDGESWVHKGGGFVPFKLPPKGVFTFTVQLLKGGGLFRAGQIRWCLQYLDAKNYVLYEIDRRTFWAGVIAKGQRLERVKTQHNLGDVKVFTLRIEVTPDRLVQQVRVGNEWRTLDSFAEPGRDFTQGKFGFLIQGNDEIAISDFQFLPK